MSANFGNIISTGNNNSFNNINTGIANRNKTLVCPDSCTSKAWLWISKIILALGALLLIAGSIALAKNLLPFGASVTFISMGSIFIISALFRFVLPWIKEKFDITSYNGINGGVSISGSGIIIVNGRVLSPSNGLIEGSGTITQRESNLSTPVTTIQISGSAELFLSQGDDNTLSISAEENIIDLLEQKIDGNELILGVKPNVVFKTHRPIVYKLIVADPQKLIVSGTANVTIDRLKGASFTCDISGSGDVKIQAGEVKQQHVIISGSGDYKAANLKSQTAQINISGTGDAVIHADKSLAVSISGCGECGYYGNPSISKSIRGSGSLRKFG